MDRCLVINFTNSSLSDNGNQYINAVIFNMNKNISFKNFMGQLGLRNKKFEVAQEILY